MDTDAAQWREVLLFIMLGVCFLAISSCSKFDDNSIAGELLLLINAGSVLFLAIDSCSSFDDNSIAGEKYYYS